MSDTQDTPNLQIPFLIHQSQIPTGEIHFRHLIATPTIAKGDLLYGDGSNNFVRVPVGSEGQVLTSKNGVPAYQTPASPTSTSFTNYGTGSGNTSSSTMSDLGCSAAVTTTSKCNILVTAEIQCYANPATAVEYLGQIIDQASALVGLALQISLMSGNRRQIMKLSGRQANLAAGTYTYKLQHRNGDNATTCTAEQAQITVFAVPTT